MCAEVFGKGKWKVREGCEGEGARSFLGEKENTVVDGGCAGFGDGGMATTTVVSGDGW